MRCHRRPGGDIDSRVHVHAPIHPNREAVAAQTRFHTNRAWAQCPSSACSCPTVGYKRNLDIPANLTTATDNSAKGGSGVSFPA